MTVPWYRDGDPRCCYGLRFSQACKFFCLFLSNMIQFLLFKSPLYVNLFFLFHGITVFFFSTPEIKMIQFPQNVAVCNVMKQTVNVHVLSTFCVIKAFDSGVILKTWIICILLVFLGRWIFFVFGQKWQVLHVNGSAVTELNRR